jgi:ankyrin repeat protein
MTIFLEDAIKKGFLGEVIKCIASMQKCNQCIDYLKYMLQAIKENHMHIVKYFVSLGCASSKSFGAALIKSAECGHYSMVKYFFESKKIISDSDKVNAFMLSVDNGHFEISNYFMENGLNCGPSHRLNYNLLKDKDSIMKKNEATLHFSIRMGQVDIVKYLIENGLDATNICLRLAIEYKHWDIAKYLVYKGCDIVSVGDMTIPMCIDLNVYEGIQQNDCSYCHPKTFTHFCQQSDDCHRKTLKHFCQQSDDCHRKTLKHFCQQSDDCHPKTFAHFCQQSDDCHPTKKPNVDSEKNIAEITEILEINSEVAKPTKKFLEYPKFPVARSKHLKYFYVEAEQK